MCLLLFAMKAKEIELKDIISEEQAMNFLRINGSVPRWDTKAYLESIPFHHAANELQMN